MRSRGFELFVPHQVFTTEVRLRFVPPTMLATPVIEVHNQCKITIEAHHEKTDLKVFVVVIPKDCGIMIRSMDAFFK